MTGDDTPFPAPDPGFRLIGPRVPATPVLISVPHAGRDYPPSLLADAAVPEARLRQLEDRHADALVAKALALGATAIVATRARAWIDLNRDPREMDPGMIEGPLPGGLHASARTRAGLGLVPRRLGGSLELWRRKLSAAELAERVTRLHQPYHASIAEMLEAARARHGLAILLDCHSMPPLRPDASGMRAGLVIGDRFARSAAPVLVDRIEAAARNAGLQVARNTPYAGGHVLERHADPARGVHAIQIEIDRSLYLDETLDAPGPGLAAMQALLGEIWVMLGREADSWPVAAE